ncbi:MAG TPA: cell wall hydrolase [Novosphingobium sp.]|nr:cell wall hydrolase [Novosphingobium sp.]
MNDTQALAIDGAHLPRTHLPRIRLILVAAFLVALALAVAIAWPAPVGQPSGRTAAQATALKDLPARPEDIEAHGAQARSVLKPDDARATNAKVAFASGPLDVARPFAFKGSDADRGQALECLATAVLHEAGDDATGEAAVAQVVLNRVRHAAFPPTVCGVVYQGSQRATGCQFTFTCDGSLRRRMSDGAWRRARQVADRALAGWVDRSVGLATHYHTDWVYPYWSPSLDKLARVGTHLFFGWPGSWGGPRAFGRAYRGNEGPTAPERGSDAPLRDDPGAPKILGLPLPPARLPAGMGKVPLYGNKLRLTGSDGRRFGLLAPADATSARLVNAALALCASPGPCQVLAWGNEDDIPGEFPIPAGARGTMVFEYVRGAEAGKGTVRFECGRFPNKDPKLCLSGAAQAPLGLSGVRWKTD